MSHTQNPRFTHELWSDWSDAQGVASLDKRFLQILAQSAPQLSIRLIEYRDPHTQQTASQISELLLALAPYLEAFIAELFDIQTTVDALKASTLATDPIMQFKKQFVQRRARRYRGEITYSLAELNLQLAQCIESDNGFEQDKELAIARYAQQLLCNIEQNKQAIDQLTQWCVLQLQQPGNNSEIKHWVSFRLPKSIDHSHLVPTHSEKFQGIDVQVCPPEDLRPRDGFRLTDPRMNPLEIQNEIHYCVYCHQQDGDFCSKGFPVKKGNLDQGYKRDPLGVTLTGCPLEEKISEMHQLKRDGFSIAALAVAMVDNPMIPATGHRICNDCMKACIYQKQDPVNIPETETRILTDVLTLPWGVEIYDLLTRWNPLRSEQYLCKPFNGHRVLIAGMGPAGFTMAHHLTMEGCAVVGIDGLKIEPLPQHLLTQPIERWEVLEEALDERILLGFGGVAEYGITVRWDKNFLKLIYLSLVRRAHFQIFGGIRLGGTLTLEDAAVLGFDHVCIATGAGLPHVLNIPNSMARGMRQASDFLMALQLTGAAKKSSLASLQIRLPAVVIGGGLTAIDTATELQALYIQQVEKIADQFDTLSKTQGTQQILQGLSLADQAILREYLAHGKAVSQERACAKTENRPVNFTPLLHQWGGVSIVYRKGMIQSPAYLRNHEEIIKAIQEGIFYLEGLAPIRVEVDEVNRTRSLACQRMRVEQGRWINSDQVVTIACHTVLVATGSKPNTIYAQEYPNSLELDENHFKPYIYHQAGLQPLEIAEHCKSENFGAFTSYEFEKRFATFIGDTNPVFHGSVVKAIASSKRIYPQIIEALQMRKADVLPSEKYPEFRTHLHHQLTPMVTEINVVHPSLTEIWVRAPQAAKNFHPGQFFRLQTFEQFSPLVNGTRLQIPLMTVSGTGVRNDEIRLLVLQWGSLPKLALRLKPGTPIVLMGPNGAATHIPSGKTILIVAGRWGAAVMRDIGPALRHAGNRVCYVALHTDAQEIDNQDELETGADQIIWCTQNHPKVPARRPFDLNVISDNVIDLLMEYEDSLRSELGDGAISLASVDTLMVMGSTGLLSGFQLALKSKLGGYFGPHLEAIGTVGSPMQCMLKGVCAQCLQWQIDPHSGRRTQAVFSCAQQDQPLAWIDVENLKARQTQNTLQDYLTGHWLNKILFENENIPNVTHFSE